MNNWKYYFRLLSISVVVNAALFAQPFDLPPSALNSITKNDALQHLQFLASDALEGRGNGSQALKVTAAYISSLFEKWDLEPIDGAEFLQPFFYSKSKLSDNQQCEFQFRRNSSTTALTGSYFSDYFIQFDRNNDLSLSAPIVFCGYGIKTTEVHWDDYAGVKLDGKAALVLDGLPPLFADNGESVFGRSKAVFKNPLQKAKWAAEAGASVLLVILDENEFPLKANQYQRAVTRTFYYVSSQESERIPIIFISEPFSRSLFREGEFSLREIKDQMLKNKKSRSTSFRDISVNLKIDFERDLQESANVFGVKQGSDPQLKNEYIFITAHYDHLGINDGQIMNGADDNASGTSGMLEIAEAFSRHIADNKRSIAFAAFGGEELNLLGSRFFLDNTEIPVENIVACINLDMIGRGEENELSIIGVRYSADLQKVTEACNQATGFDLNYNGQFFVSKSDQWPFITHQIPSLFYFAGMHDDYHKATDDVEKINFRKLVKISQLAATVAYNLSQDLNRPQWHPKNR